MILAATICSSCSSLMETSPTTDVDKEKILADVEGLQVAMNGVYATMYNRLNFVSANAHQCFGNMAVTLAADLMGDDMVQTAQGAGWFWKDYNYDQRSRYTSKIWRCYFTWEYFYEIISNVNHIISAAETATKVFVTDLRVSLYGRQPQETRMKSSARQRRHTRRGRSAISC